MMVSLAAALLIAASVGAEAFAPTSVVPRALRKDTFKCSGRGPLLRAGASTLKMETESTKSKLKLFRMLDEAAEMIAEAVALKPAAEADSKTEATPEAETVELRAAHDTVSEMAGEQSAMEVEEAARANAEASISRLDQILQERQMEAGEPALVVAEDAVDTAGDLARSAVAEVVAAEGIPLSAFAHFDPKVRDKLAEADLDGNHVLDAQEIVKAFESCFEAVDANKLSAMSTSSRGTAENLLLEALSATADKLVTAEQAAREAVAMSLAEQIVSEGTTYRPARDDDEESMEYDAIVKAAPRLTQAEEAARAAVAASLADQIVSEGTTYKAAREEEKEEEDATATDAVALSVAAHEEVEGKDPVLLQAEEAARRAVAAALGETA
jgi:hypothetical protein